MIEQYIDEYGNLQFRNVGTTNEYPFRSMAEMAAENAKAINSQFLTPPDTLTSLQNFQDNYYLPNRNTSPIKSLGIDTSYGVANEPDVAQIPFPNASTISVAFI